MTDFREAMPLFAVSCLGWRIGFPAHATAGAAQRWLVLWQA
ncbi:hypothetical protein RA280_45645 [Cupriavidus sp. CV2]|nr:hypothetical protein [Cupriavidus sp. CV2]